MSVVIDTTLVQRLHQEAGASRWEVEIEMFGRALAASAARAFGDRAPSGSELSKYLSGLHLEDLALACACADGHEAAWEHFVPTYRPTLYRSADVIDPSGGARDLADEIYADLFGLKAEGGQRRSLLRSFHGRSSLATWLRSVLAQRHIDRHRATRRLRPIPDEESPSTLAAPPSAESPGPRALVIQLRRALASALQSLPARDRLRIRCYYAQGLTLADIGRMTREHEATVSRKLARSRRAIREDVERRLRNDAGLDEAQIAECFSSLAADPGLLDLSELLDDSAARKKPTLDRSTEEPLP